jgi:hypothetical protein
MLRDNCDLLIPRRTVGDQAIINPRSHSTYQHIALCDAHGIIESQYAHIRKCWVRTRQTWEPLQVGTQIAAEPSP